MKYPIYVWATGGLGMQFAGHLFAPENLGSTKANEFFFRNGKPSPVYVDHAEHMINNHRKKENEINKNIYNKLLEDHRDGLHIVIHQAGLFNYGRCLRIFKHVANQEYYSTEFINVTSTRDSDMKKLRKALWEMEEIGYLDEKDNCSITRITKLVGRHYLKTAQYAKKAGLKIFEIDYYDFLVKPNPDKITEMFEFVDANISVEETCNRIEEYHLKNLELFEHFAGKEKTDILIQKLLTKPVNYV